MSSETVLIIDDSPTILKVVQLVLAKAGYRVHTASAGDEGLRLAQQDPPDLILLDFIMPKLDGYQVCQALQQITYLREVPVILMSAKGDHVGERFVQAHGVVDYITKPFSPEAITGIVRHTIDKFRRRPASESPEAEQVTASLRVAPQPVPAKATRGREALVQAISQAVVRGAAEQAIALDPAAVVTWITQGLRPEQHEQLGRERGDVPLQIDGDATVALFGDLSVVPIAEVLSLLSFQEQTGQLAIARDNVRVELHFRKGLLDLAAAHGVAEELRLGRFVLENNLLSQRELDLVLRQTADDALSLAAHLIQVGRLAVDELNKAIRQQSCELVYEVLRWSYGRFTFHASDESSSAAQQAALGLCVEGILMEGFRRVDEWHLIEREIDDFELVFVRNEDAVSRMGRGRLTREELAILDLVNGKHTVKEIVRESRMGSFDVSKMLFRLYSIKLIRKRVPPVAV